MEKVSQPATLPPLEVHGQVILFWKPSISQYLEPSVNGKSRAIIAQNPHSKMANL